MKNNHGFSRPQWVWLACATAFSLAAPWQVSQAQQPAASRTDFVIDRSSRAQPSESEQSRATLEAFSRAYAKAGKPRVALFWNRALTDRLANDTRDVARLFGRERQGEFAIAASRSSETDVEQGRRTDLSERDLWQVETEFTRRMLDAGVNLVDRAAIMRLTAGSQASSAQTQAVEVSALLGKADLWLEVLLARDSEAPLGWGFRGNMKEVKTGRTLGALYLTALPALPEPGQPTYRMRPGGYDLVAPEPSVVTVQVIGSTLALDLMRELTRRLGSTVEFSPVCLRRFRIRCARKAAKLWRARAKRLPVSP